MNIWCAVQSEIKRSHSPIVIPLVTDALLKQIWLLLVLLYTQGIKINNKEAIKEFSRQTRRHEISRDVCQISITNENSVILIILMTQPKYN